MNKYGFFILLVGWLFAITFIVTAVENVAPGTFVISGDLQTAPVPDANFVTQLSQLALTFWGLLTFNVTGFPAVASFIFIQLPTFALIYIFVDIVKDVIPLT